MNYQGLGFWLDFSGLCAAGIVGVYSWITRRDGARQKDMTVMCKAMEAIGNRVTHLETGMIGHHDLAAVHKRINEVSAQVSHISGQLTAVSSSLNMIQDHLLNKEK